MSTATPTVHIIDDDASFLTAMARLMRASGFSVRNFTSGGEFLAQLDSTMSGCVVVDLQMPGMDGLALQAALARSNNPLPVVFLTAHGDIPTAVGAISSGAVDFLEKRSAKEALLDAVRRAFVRDAEERPARARRNEMTARFGTLSQRELEVLAHVVRGKLNKQIASDLGIHERTVKVHRKAITTKLGVRSAAELARLAHEAGFFASPAGTFPKGQ